MRKCELCGSSSAETRWVIKTDDLISLNKARFDIDISELFHGHSELNLLECGHCGLGFYDPSILGDSKYYSTLGQNDWYYHHEGKTELTVAKEFISENQSVLDVGSGSGRFQSFLNATCDYLGIELSDQAVKKAESLGINVQKKDLFKLKNDPQNKFDVVVSFQVLEHVLAPADFVNEMALLLKEKGKIILAVPNNDSILFREANVLLNMPPHHNLLWNEKSLTFLANKLNLKIEKIIKENVQEVHRVWFYRALVKSFLQKVGIIDRKILTRQPNLIFEKMISLMAKLVSFLDYRKFDGHTIIIILSKK